MLKKLFLYFLSLLFIFIIILSVNEAFNNNPLRIFNNLNKRNSVLANIAVPLSVKDSVYQPGRKLIFVAKYMNIIPLGTAVMIVDAPSKYRGQKVYLLSAEAKIGRFFATFYEVKARVESFVDINKLYPLLYKEEMYEKGKLERTKEIEYDQKNLLMVRDGKIKRRIVPNTFDPLSSFFYLRIQDFQTQKESKIKMISKEDAYLFENTVLGKKDGIWIVKSKVGRENKSSSRGAEFLIWISADNNRLPLLIKVKSKAGPFTMRLVEVK